MAKTLRKQPGENVLFEVDFSDQLITGETIQSVTSIVGSPSGLTFGAPQISGSKVQFTIADGTSGQVYKLTLKLVTLDSPVFEADVHLLVIEQ